MPNSAEHLLNTAEDDSTYIERMGVGVFASAGLLNEPGLTHGFACRKGGVSLPPFDSLNLGTGRAEPIENILTNYKILCEAHGLCYDELALVRHEHGANILKLTAEDGGRGIALPPLDYSDGFVTNDPGVTLMTCHADCSAFFLYDKATRSIGLAHAGWKGMYARIGQKLAMRLAEEYGAEPKNIMAVVGPCICEKCFEVETELAERFAKEFDCPDIYGSGEDGIFYKPGRAAKQGKAYVSLHAAAIIQLLDAGLKLKNIRLMRRCTFEDGEHFFSYRRDGLNTGSMAAFLRLK